MSARDEILKRIRQNLPQSTPLPSLEGNWIRYDDPVQQFCDVLNSVGGRAHIVETLSEIPPLLSELAAADRLVVSTIPGLLDDRFDLQTVSDPHDLDRVDLAILPGELAVAENGAVWVTDQGLPHRVLYFICQHLALVIPHQAVVHNMHEAYDRVSPGRRPFGCFISGPSKTADIEQSLVLGAHGARTLNVFLVRTLSPSSQQ